MVEPDIRQIPEQVIRARDIVVSVLGHAVVGVYLFGSAVVGGLRRDSDLDILVVANQTLPEAVRKMLLNALMTVSGGVGSGSLGRPLELTVVRLSDISPWRYPPRNEFLYGEWLREDFENGAVPAPASNPDLAIVLKNVRDHGITLLGPDASTLLDPVPMEDIRRAISDSLLGLVENMKGDERNVLLTLARMWLTVAVGEIAAKDIAAEWAMCQLPASKALLLDRARREYLGESEYMWDSAQEEVATLVAHIRSSIEVCLASRAI